MPYWTNTMYWTVTTVAQQNFLATKVTKWDMICIWIRNYTSHLVLDWDMVKGFNYSANYCKFKTHPRGWGEPYKPNTEVDLVYVCLWCSSLHHATRWRSGGVCKAHFWSVMRRSVLFCQEHPGLDGECPVLSRNRGIIIGTILSSHKICGL
jgi:hypothetical protein